MPAPDLDEKIETEQGEVARETRLSGKPDKSKREGCVKNIMLACGVIFLLFTGVFCIGGAAVIAQEPSGEALVPFTCMGIFSLASGLLLIQAYRRLGKETGPEVTTVEPVPAASENWREAFQAGDFKASQKMDILIGVARELMALSPEISGFSQQYPMRSLMGGAGVAKAEKQIPWIARTLLDAAGALTTGKDPFGNPITMTETKNGLVQLVNIVCDPEYLTFMEMIYEGIADPLKNSMQELEQIIERIPA